MGKYKERMLQDLRKVVGYSSGYIKRDSAEIEKRIENKMAVTNCKRIIFVMPVLVLMDIYAVFVLCTTHNRREFYQPISSLLRITPHMLVLSAVFLMVLSVVYTVWIFQKLYVHQQEDWKAENCQFIYRTFWFWWIGSMAFIALGCAIVKRSWVFFIIVCMIFCLIPLFCVWDFIWSIAYVCVLARSVLMVAGERSKEFDIVFYMSIGMMAIGYVAQIFEKEMWTLREYVYVKTFVDDLTLLLNRRGGNAVVEQELRKCDGKTTLGVIMLDVDYFKKYNDSLGHDAGDHCLKEIGACIRETVSNRTDAMIRHGGEEFVVLLFGTTQEETSECAERICQSVYARGIPTPYQEIAKVVTVSVGATVVQTDGNLMYENILKTADLALYCAKEAGRNQVVFR